jgi:hypothetical protein
LQAGDKVGFISEGFGTVAYNDGDEEVDYKNLGSNGAPLLGGNVIVPNIIKRIFSLSVTVGKLSFSVPKSILLTMDQVLFL